MCIDDNKELAEALLANGANVDACDNEDWTPLHAACSCGHLSIVSMLLRHGASLTAVTLEGQTPHDLALESENDGVDAVAQLLVSEAARQGEPPHVAARTYLSAHPSDRLPALSPSPAWSW